MYLTISSGLGLGLSPILPGSCGALIGVGVHGVTVSLLPADFRLPVLILFFISVCLVNDILTPWAQTYWKHSDPGHFILDEIAGYMMIPILFHHGVFWRVALLGFVLFRIFDIYKLIPPAKYIDRNFKNSWGILLDDIVSGAYAALCIYIVYWIKPEILTGGLF